MSSTTLSVRQGAKVAANLLFARAAADPTSEWKTLEALGLAHPERAPYVASPWWVLHWVLRGSTVRPGSVFVDFGCGKGRVVLAAARQYRFAEVIGVELSPELSSTARALIERDRHRFRAGAVRVETVDATAFAVPDALTHAFMFNPFRGEIFNGVIRNVIASLDRRPRELRLFYANPEEHDGLVATGRFRLERRVRTTRLVAPIAVATYVAT